MKRFLILTLCLLALAGCGKRASWHQMMVLYFDTPTGPLQVEQVVAVDFRGHSKLFIMTSNDIVRPQGEAAVVEMGDGRYLFVLLGGVENLLYYALRTAKGESGYIYTSAVRDIKRQRDPIEVPRKYWPMLMTFDDIADPTSVRLMDADNLAARFGAGYALRSITVQVTRKPVTAGRVEQVLGWIDNLDAYRTIPDNPFTNTLSPLISGLRKR